ncbi:MAG: hypothetical protein ACRYHA_15625 [Janthinobacterium lividum]
MNSQTARRENQGKFPSARLPASSGFHPSKKAVFSRYLSRFRFFLPFPFLEVFVPASRQVTRGFLPVC